MNDCNDEFLTLTYRAPHFKPIKSSVSASTSDVRAPYQRDLGRIVHSSSFRRLQTKTQVMGAGEGDFHRTRLTHSLEVGQIGRGIIWDLSAKIAEIDQCYLPSAELMEAICYGHDLGHPPFGHGGEVALHGKMKRFGGFEGNAQTLRILTKLEHYSAKDGLCATRRLLLGVLKYPVSYGEYGELAYTKKPPKCFYDDDVAIIERALEPFSENDTKVFRTLGDNGKPLHKTFDCAIMEVADDIAYGVHDLEDGIGRGFLKKEEIADKIRDIFEDCGIEEITAGSVKLSLDGLLDNLFSKEPSKRKFAISILVGYFVGQVQVRRQNLFDSPYFDLTVEMPEGPRKAINFLSKKITYENIISRPEIKTLEFKGERIICQLFDAFSENPLDLIGREKLDAQTEGLTKVLDEVSANNSDWLKQDGPNRDLIKRGICDFIASMTDASAERYHRRLFEPGYGSSTDELL